MKSIYETVFEAMPSPDQLGMVVQGMQVMTGEPWTAAQVESVYGNLVYAYGREDDAGMLVDNMAMPPRERAYFDLIDELRNIIVRQDSDRSHGFTDWPYFEQTFQREGRHAGGGAALLIGAISAFSSCAFQKMATEVYGADSALTVDIAPAEFTARHGAFMHADALRLPLRDESIAVAQVSQLLHMLEDPSGVSGASIGEKMQRLYSEIGRVLRPGGQLLMIETAPDMEDLSSEQAWILSSQRAKHRLHQTLRDTGFGRVVVEDGYTHEGTTHLFDPTFRAKPWPATNPRTNFFVYAVKPIAL